MLLVIRPGSIDARTQADLSAYGDFSTVHVDSLECPRRTAAGLRYRFDSDEIYDLLVIPFSELACVRLIEHSLPAVIAYGPVDRMESAFLLGAGDYLAEPWTAGELVVRSRRILAGYPSTESVDYFDGAILRAGRFVSFTEKERRIFELLRRHTGRIIDRETLGLSIGVSPDQLRRGSRAIDMAISRIRRVLSDSGVIIETIRGIGYRLRVDNRWINASEKRNSRESS